MALSPLAGKPAPTEMLIDVAALERAYYDRKPDLADPRQRVSFGTSGHRGTPLRRHVHRGPHPGDHAGDLRVPRSARASTARCSWARTRTPCPAPAQRTALEVLAANGVDDGHPGAATASRRRRSSRAPSWSTTAAAREQLADGIVITPSHNPPEDGGFKYNPPNGGPADTDVTSWVQDRANELLRGGNRRSASACRSSQALRGRHHARSRISSRPTSSDLAQRRRHGRDPRRRR